MTNSKNKSFIIHLDSLEILDQLDDNQAGKLFKAIHNFQKTHAVGKVDKITNIAITPFINQFKRDNEKYEAICSRNRKNIARRWNTKNTTGKTGIPNDTKNTYSDSDSDSDSDSKKKEKIIKKENSHFNEFWQKYTPITTTDNKCVPKGDKQKALKSFEKALKETSFENLLKCLESYLTNCKRNNLLTKHAVSWLNSSPWDYELEKNVPTYSDEKSNASTGFKMRNSQSDKTKAIFEDWAEY